MTRRAGMILIFYCLAGTLICLRVPFTAHFRGANQPRQEFVGYAWVWSGPGTAAPYDLLWEARRRWHGTKAPTGAFWYTRDVRGGFRGVYMDFHLGADGLPRAAYPWGPGSDLSKYLPGNDQAVRFLAAYETDPQSADPSSISKRMEYMSDGDVLEWLEKKNNFDRTFPERASFGIRERQKLFDQWRQREEAVERAWKAQYASVDYARIGLELLALTLMAGVAFVFAWRKRSLS